MFLRTYLGRIAAVLALLLPAQAEVYFSEDQALKLAFPRADRIEKQLIALTADERATIDKRLGTRASPRIFKYWVGSQKGVVIGYAVIDDVLGKDQPITYMLSVDEKLVVRSVEILAYRESRGGEIRQADWRAQFDGGRAESPLRIGSDIRNIAGATISCRSLTDGVRRQLVALSVLVKPITRPVQGGPAAGARPGTEPLAPSASVPAVAGETSRKPPTWGGAEPVPAAVSRPSNAVLVSRKQLAMGTTLEIRAYAENRDVGLAVLERALAEVARLEGILSTWREESEVSRLNRAAGGPPRPASPELLDLCSRSLELSERTSGAFDVGIGPLIELWKEASRTGKAPGTEEVEKARDCGGPMGVQVDRARGTLRLARPGAALDFGAIGKGYALDRAAAKLEEGGLHAALLDFGGQLLALDPPPDEASWSALIRDPALPEQSLTRIRLVRASISSTGDYERGMSVLATRISHIVDPRTGRPVEGMLGTSVVAPTACEADALSTALYVLGYETAVHYAELHALPALVVAPGGRVTRTKSFRALELVSEEVR